MQMGGAGGAKGKGKGGEEEMVRLGKEEVQKIQAKAMKVRSLLLASSYPLTVFFEQLAFDRDVEIVSASSQLPATTSIFSFPIVTKLSTSATSPVVTTSPLSSLPSSSTHTRSLSSHSTSSILSPSHTQTYHCVSLLVWSHADGPRSAAIRASLAQGAAKARAEAARKAAEAAKAGRKLGERLERRMRGPLMGAAGGGVWSDTEGETEGICASFSLLSFFFFLFSFLSFFLPPPSTDLDIPQCRHRERVGDSNHAHHRSLRTPPSSALSLAPLQPPPHLDSPALQPPQRRSQALLGTVPRRHHLSYVVDAADLEHGGESTGGAPYTAGQRWREAERYILRRCAASFSTSSRLSHFC